MIYRFISWSIILFACFYGIGLYPLFDNNEGYYAAIARDMLHNHDFIIPHLNGVPYIEKPPMLYWLMTFSMSCFGVHDWAAQLIPALALFATTVQIHQFLIRHTKDEVAAFTAAFLFSTSLPLLAMERMIFCDMLMTCFLTAAITQCYEWHRSNKRRHLLWFWAMLALAVLSKGFVAMVLAMGTILVFHFLQRLPLRQLLPLFSPAGLGVFLCIAGPWLIGASLQHSGFAWYYIVNEHILRFLNKREPHDYYTGPLWYYLPRLLGYLIPWSFFLLLFIKKDKVVQLHHHHLKHFLGTWFWFTLAFFSLSGGKANYYMLPGIPALIMGIALQWQSIAGTSERIARSVIAGCLLLLALVLMAGQYFCVHGIGDFYNGCQGISEAIVIGSTLYLALFILLCWRLPLQWLPPLLASHIVLFLPLLISGVNLADGRLSQKDVADYLNANTKDDIAIYQDFEEVSSLAFYLPNPLRIVNSKSDDLLYGMHLHPDAPTFITLVQWNALSPSIPILVLNKKIPAFYDHLTRAQLDIKSVCLEKRFERLTIMRKCAKETP